MARLDNLYGLEDDTVRNPLDYFRYPIAAGFKGFNNPTNWLKGPVDDTATGVPQVYDFANQPSGINGSISPMRPGGRGVIDPSIAAALPTTYDQVMRRAKSSQDIPALQGSDVGNPTQADASFMTKPKPVKIDMSGVKVPGEHKPGDDIYNYIMARESYSPQPFVDGYNKNGDRIWSTGYGSRQHGQWAVHDSQSAEAAMHSDVRDAHSELTKAFPDVAMTRQQYMGLIALGHNLGPGVYRDLKPYIDKGDWQGASDKLQEYTHQRQADGSMKELPGLIDRRAREGAMLTNNYDGEDHFNKTVIDLASSAKSLKSKFQQPGGEGTTQGANQAANQVMTPDMQDKLRQFAMMQAMAPQQQQQRSGGVPDYAHPSNSQNNIIALANIMMANRQKNQG